MTKQKWKVSLWIAAFFVLIVFFFLKAGPLEKQLGEQKNISEAAVVMPSGGNDTTVIQKAIDESAASKSGSVILGAHHTYHLKSSIVVKSGVQLRLSAGTKIVIDGDFKGIELEKDASLINGTIEVVDPAFSSEVIYVRGNEFYDSTNETRIENVKILNSSKQYAGTGISFYAKDAWHNISFVNVMNVTITGFETGVKLEAEPPEKKETYSWVNANRFVNLSMEDCVTFIEIIGTKTIPNECSGNFFTGLQIQLTEKTKRLFVVNGSYNKFEGMVWDQQRIQHDNPLIYFSKRTESNTVETNVESERIEDQGVKNKGS